MTRSELEDRLTAHFENPTYYQSIDLSDSIQDGYDEVIATTGAIIKSATIAFTQNITYYDILDLIPDCIAIIAIFNPITAKWLIPVTLRKIEQNDPEWETKVGSPEWFTVISHRYIAIYRKPSTVGYGNMYVYYTAAAPSIGGSDSFQIRDEHVRVIEEYCITDLWEQNQEFGKSGNHFLKYISNIETMRTQIKNYKSSDRIKGLKG